MPAAQDIQRFRIRRRANIEKISKALGITAVQAKRELVQELFQKLVVGTPVDTGRARGSWNITEGTPDFSTLPEGPAVGLGAATGAEKFARLRYTDPDEKVHMANGVEYIVPLEFGHSSQAPSGWVRSAVNDVALKLRAEAAAANKAKQLGLRIR